MEKEETACATLSDLIDTKKEAEAECLTDIDDSVFIIGCIKDTDHFNWIFRDEEQPYYNIRQGHRLVHADLGKILVQHETVETVHQHVDAKGFCGSLPRAFDEVGRVVEGIYR